MRVLQSIGGAMTVPLGAQYAEKSIDRRHRYPHLTWPALVAPILRRPAGGGGYYQLLQLALDFLYQHPARDSGDHYRLAHHSQQPRKPPATLRQNGLCLNRSGNALSGHRAGALQPITGHLVVPELWIAAQVRKRAQMMSWTPGLVMDYTRALYSIVHPDSRPWFRRLPGLMRKSVK